MTHRLSPSQFRIGNVFSGLKSWHAEGVAALEADGVRIRAARADREASQQKLRASGLGKGTAKQLEQMRDTE